MASGPEKISVGEVNFGDLRRVIPISTDWGFDRGRPIDRYYIERFLRQHASDIRGRVVEIGDAAYTRRFGAERVTHSDVLNVYEGNPETTIRADLTSAPEVPSNTFDCIVFTQTLQLVYDLEAAVRTLHRILKPGGTLLATFPGITHTSDTEWSKHWCWSLTRTSSRRLFETAFSPENVYVEGHGNVLAAISFLCGLATEELDERELDYSDPAYDVTIGLRAVKNL
jgi:SAM-dependent methyltransferase